MTSRTSRRSPAMACPVRARSGGQRSLLPGREKGSAAPLGCRTPLWDDPPIRAGLLAVVVSACRPLVHPVLGPRLGLGPIREMLRAAPDVLGGRGSPGVLGAMQVAAPSLPVLRE